MRRVDAEAVHAERLAGHNMFFKSVGITKKFLYTYVLRVVGYVHFGYCLAVGKIGIHCVSSRDLTFPLEYFIGEHLAVRRLAVKTHCRKDIRLGTHRNKKFSP